jgi:nicotinamide-nucleotide amidase
MFAAPLIDEASRLVAALRARGAKIVTAESLTGGLIAAVLTEVAGSSEVFECGFVTYSNAAKEHELGVSGELLARHGAVSAEVAQAMAVGALARIKADVAVSSTGIAGPGGGSTAKPVGLVYLGAAVRGHAAIHVECRFGDIGRVCIRQASTAAALALLWQALASDGPVQGGGGLGLP